jgi:hypothetical protein
MIYRNLLAVTVVVFIVTAPAADARMRGNFDDADANHDGVVTLQEYETYVAERLSSANGRLAQWFRELTPQQRAARLQRRFKRRDHGNKGYLDRNDWNGA